MIAASRFALLLQTCGAATFAGLLPLGAAAQSPPSSAGGIYREKVDLIDDSSVADSLDRQHNARFESVRIDGEAPGVSLSALTTDQILAAETLKVPTPDHDADAVGGYLELTSRPAFLQERPTLRGGVAVTHDPRTTRPAVVGSVTFGRRLGRKNAAGFLATVEHRRDEEDEEQVELNWRGDRRELEKFAFGRSGQRARELNFNGSLDWKIGDQGMAFVRTQARVSRERDLERSLTVELPPGVGSGAGEVLGATLRHAIEEGWQQQRALLLAAGAKHEGRDWRLELRLSLRVQTDHQPDERSYEFSESGVHLGYDHSDPQFPRATAAHGTPLGQPGRALLDELQRHREDERVTDGVAAFDVTRRGTRDGQPAWWKAGFKARSGRTGREERHEVYTPRGSAIVLGEFRPVRGGEVLSGRYVLPDYPDPRALRRVFDTRADRLELDRDQTAADTDPANFVVQQDVLAGYLLGSVMWAGTRVVAGVRAERTASGFRGAEVAFDEEGRYAGTAATRAARVETDVFPGLHVSRTLPGGVVAYASWTRSIRRPDYTDLVPARRIFRAVRELEEGNARLRSSVYTNYDLSLDYNCGPGGQLTLELFHRDIGNPTLSRRTLLLDGPFAGFERERPENGAHASLQGGELSWEQELGPLERGLEGYTVRINYRQERSRQTVESRPGESPPLVDRPRRALAVQLACERGPYYVALEYEWAGERLVSLGRLPGEDRIEPAAASWKLSVSREFNPGFRLVLDVDNLAAISDRRYSGEPSRPDRYELDVRTFRLGLKWER